MQESKVSFQELLKLNLWNFLCAREKLKSTQNTEVEEYKKLFQTFLTFKDIKPIFFKEPVSESDPNYWHLNCSMDKDWEKRMKKRRVDVWAGLLAEGKNAHRYSSLFGIKGDKILLTPYLAIEYIGKDADTLLFSLLHHDEHPFFFYLKTIAHYIPNIKDISKNFLQTKSFEHFLLLSYAQKCMKQSEIYLNLTLCSLVESVRRYPESQYLMPSDKQVLEALVGIRNKYFAHNNYFPDLLMDSSETKDFSVLLKNKHLDWKFIEKWIKKTVSQYLGGAEKELLSDLKKQNFPNLTKKGKNCGVVGFISEVNNLYDYIENDLGIDRKDIPYLFKSVVPDNDLLNDNDHKSKRNRLLHEKIENRDGLFLYDSNDPLSTLERLKEQVAFWGKEHVKNRVIARKELEKENKERTSLRVLLRNSSLPKKKKESVLKRLKKDTPRRKEKALEYEVLRSKIFDFPFKHVKITRIR